ncbi:MAG: molybdate ABC transporter substrate-binding protein [Candidatus Dadabacteria bacterium]|nr:MAG: molybdate ABC transporter substrate-binding protein [Candidatus Dadabacteria bacterium]
MRHPWLALLLLVPGLARGDPLAIGAASSLTDVLPRLARAFTKTTGAAAPVASFGSSGTVARQVVSGAPLDVVVLADPGLARALTRRGLLEPGSLRCVATNRLSLVVPRKSRTVASWADLGAPAAPRTALGDPAHVPAGALARRHLEALGLWTAVLPRAVFAASARQALAYARRAEVDAAVVFRTDALSAGSDVREVDTAPLAARYVAGVVVGTPQPADARRFTTFLAGPAGQALFAEAGFGACPGREP